MARDATVSRPSPFLLSVVAAAAVAPRSRRRSGLSPARGRSRRRRSRCPRSALGGGASVSVSRSVSVRRRRRPLASWSSPPAARARGRARAGRPAARSCSRVTRWTPRPTVTASAEPEQAEQDRAHQFVTASGRTTSVAGPARRRAVALPGADRRRAAPAPRERLDDREAEPGAGAIGAAAPEALEDAPLLTRRHAGALVEHSEAAVRVPGHRHGRPGRRVDKRVLDQVVERDRDVLVGGADEARRRRPRAPAGGRSPRRAAASARRPTRTRPVATPAHAASAGRPRARA